MNENEPRYKIIPINLGVAQLRPVSLPITGAKQIIFVRYEEGTGNTYPKVFNHNWLQISLDNSEEFIPIKPGDRFKVGYPDDTFHTFRYRNLRAMPNGGFAFFMILFDACFYPDNRPAEPFRLKNWMTLKDFVSRNHANRVVVLPGATQTVLTFNVPSANTGLLWGFNICNANVAGYEVGLNYGGADLRLYGDSDAALTLRHGNVGIEYPYPIELENTGVLAVTFNLNVHNLHGANSASCFGSLEYSLVPSYIAYDLPGEIHGG